VNEHGSGEASDMTNSQVPNDFGRPSRRDRDKHVKARLREIPQEVGVYLFYDKMGEVIYIGKAINLRKRVSQYFNSSRKRMEYRIQQMSHHIAHVEWHVVDSELHALLLEDQFIKKHWPMYNARQKKFLRNCYLALTDEEYPRLEILAIDDQAEGQTVFGPFPDHFLVLDLLEIVYAVYPIRHCDAAVTEARCQNHKLQNCSAPCRNRIARSQYTKIVNQVICFLNGDTREAIRGLQDRMETSTKLLEFEHAATLRDQMTFCKAFIKRQKFYDQFRKKDLVIKEWGPSWNIYLFCKGDLVGYAKEHLTHDELVNAVRKTGKKMEQEGKEPDTIFRDRANVVYGWLKNKRTQKTYEFI